MLESKNCCDDNTAKEFYNNLTVLVRKIPKHNVLVIAGDMNTKIGSVDCTGNSFKKSSNRNGQLLLDMMRECELVDLSTNYQKPKGKLWSFSYPNGVKAQIDHIIINKKLKNSAADC